MKEKVGRKAFPALFSARVVEDRAHSSFNNNDVSTTGRPRLLNKMLDF